MTKQVTEEKADGHLCERPDEVRTVNLIRHDPALRLQDFEAGEPLATFGKGWRSGCSTG